jgi:hypothetical protein
MRAIDREAVEQPDDVAAEALDRIWPRGDRRRAVPPRVVAQHAIVAHEGRELRIPHRNVGAERIRQHNDPSALGAVEAIADPRAVDLGEQGAAGGVPRRCASVSHLFVRQAQESGRPT